MMAIQTLKFKSMLSSGTRNGDVQTIVASNSNVGNFRSSPMVFCIVRRVEAPFDRNSCCVSSSPHL